ncbi:hypothetical protein H072_827 [Dactylellina haptotyla CBS 200.50]|uniref:Uncharacterized protein n=1 Tax=Dactylellina haptotyla (strain CBS 200.50) TaxID=1284197 RepID=S8AQP4_DACHA|nr:hypothetical protein H072_827 [Dactylellina haptotyla CBS 200.50]
MKPVATIFFATLSFLPSLTVAQVAAGGGVLPASAPPATTVWVTVTDALGGVQTVPSLYTQEFRSPPPMVALKSGQIGLGQWATEDGAPAAVTTDTVQQPAKRTALPSMGRHKRCAGGECH